MRFEDETALPAQEIAGVKIPQTRKQAMASPQAALWRAAMSEEMLSLYANGTFREVIPPKGSNLVSCKWVFTIKIAISRTIERYKTRLVARGFSQVHGKDYDQTFAPPVRMDTLRAFLAIVAAEDLECHQYDIKNAFTESKLKGEIFLKVPEGIPVKNGYVWQALKSLYGLKQAARDWDRLIKEPRHFSSTAETIVNLRHKSRFVLQIVHRFEQAQLPHFWSLPICGVYSTPLTTRLAPSRVRL